jgi:hypothetical protein
MEFLCGCDLDEKPGNHAISICVFPLKIFYVSGSLKAYPGNNLFPPQPHPLQWRQELYTARKNMPLSGEAIRLMNYIDDVAVTLRRVMATVPSLSDEERARVAEHLLQAHPNAEDVTKALAVHSI